MSVKKLADAYGIDIQTAKELVQSANAAIEKAIKENTEKKEEVTVDVGAAEIANIANTFTQIPEIINNLKALNDEHTKDLWNLRANKKYEKEVEGKYDVDVDGKDRTGDTEKIIKNELTNAGLSVNDADVKQLINAPTDSDRNQMIYKIYINNLIAEGYTKEQIGKVMEMIARQSGTVSEFAAVSDYIESLES